MILGSGPGGWSAAVPIVNRHTNSLSKKPENVKMEQLGVVEKLIEIYALWRLFGGFGSNTIGTLRRGSPVRARSKLGSSPETHFLNG
jgi:hypothetical protein